MKKALTILAAIFCIAGCTTGRHSQQPQKADPAAYHYQMGLSFLGERNFTSALKELTEAEKLDPENPDVLYNLGLAYLGKKRPDLAEPRFIKSLIIKPNNSAVRNDLGVAYLDLKRWDNAIEQFKIVKNDLFYENNENASINLGLAYLGKGEYQKAIEEFKGVSLSNPRNPIPFTSIGRVWAAIGKDEQAIDSFMKALSIYPDYGAANYYLAVSYLKKGEREAAKKYFQKALKLIPESELGRSAMNYLEVLK